MHSPPHKIVDPHLHFFALQKGQYDWLKTENPPFWPDKALINRSFQQQDLMLPANIKLAGFVHIEAGFDNQYPWREIDWLEQYCTLPFSSVAFADLTSISFKQDLTKLISHKSVVGIRHILDEQAPSILANTKDDHFAFLASKSLSFDAQIQLADNNSTQALFKLAKKFPQLKIIINHGGWPPTKIDSLDHQSWQLNLNQLASCNNIAIKLSAWEMLQRDWHPQFVQDILEFTIQTFGPSRVMLASNFPLCLLSKSYGELWQIYVQLLAKLDVNFKDQVTYQNALTWYRVPH